MSNINTNGIDSNYPVPGQNNSSQGFRDNFTQIKNNLNTASNEITDLQNKVVLKAALNDQVLNNDMANTLISNAAIKSFRSTTYNLGSSLNGIVLVDVNKADVQYGTITANTTLQFGGWAPMNTQSTVTLRLNISNSNAVLSLPNECVSSNNNFGVTVLENYINVGGTATITAPADTEVLEYRFSTLDCGNTINVESVNRPTKSTQVITRDPPPTGIPGDVNGTITISNSIGQVTIGNVYNNAATITANTASMTGSTITGTTLTVGTLASGNIAAGMLLTGSGVTANTYINNNISGSGSGSTWQVSQSHIVTVGPTTITGTTGIIGTTLTVGTTSGDAIEPGMVLSGSGVTSNTWIVENISGNGNGSTWRVSTTQYAAPATITGTLNKLTVTPDTSGFYRDMPIVFTGTTYGNITAGNTYYVKEVATSSSITLSTTPGGAVHTVTDNTGNTMYGNPASYIYVGTDSYNSIKYDKEATYTYVTTNIVKLNNTTSLVVNSPIIFTGTVFGGIEANVVYYVKSIDSGNANITISRTRVNGVAGSEVLLSTATGNCIATCYVGIDIFKRLNLSSW